VGPYDSEPMAEVIEAAKQRHGGDSIAAAEARWREAVEGLPLGAYDVRIVEWAVRAFDQSTLWVFAGLIDRARESGQRPAK
jgi:hypothetical protein